MPQQQQQIKPELTRVFLTAVERTTTTKVEPELAHVYLNSAGGRCNNKT